MFCVGSHLDEKGKRSVLVGGKNIIPQQYCGTVGGRSTTDFIVVGRYRNIEARFVLTTSDIIYRPATSKKYNVAPPGL
jgi:hypothetical protein